jgi:hypothetical protein
MESATAAHQAADIALTAALQECLAADLDPRPHEETLVCLLSDEVMKAVQEISVDQRSTDPLFALQVRTAIVQQIYFADAGCRAAHTLLKQLGVSHALLTTRLGA